MSVLRPLLGVFSVCWLAIAIANLEVSDDQRWFPDAVGYLALGCAICTFIMAMCPSNVFAFRFGGTLAIGTLGFRVASILLGTHSGPNDALWLSLSAVGLAVMLGALYWRWWLSDVKRFHEAHKDIQDLRGLTDDSG